MPQEDLFLYLLTNYAYTFFLPEYNSWAVKHTVTFLYFALMFYNFMS